MLVKTLHIRPNDTLSGSYRWMLNCFRREKLRMTSRDSGMAGSAVASGTCLTSGKQRNLAAVAEGQRAKMFLKFSSFMNQLLR